MTPEEQVEEAKAIAILYKAIGIEDGTGSVPRSVLDTYNRTLAAVKRLGGSSLPTAVIGLIAALAPPPKAVTKKAPEPAPKSVAPAETKKKKAKSKKW